jgi:hypothetical protein
LTKAEQNEIKALRREKNVPESDHSHDHHEQREKRIDNHEHGHE